MDFRDTLSALLPSPRDDEPASLRQDILDELGDHLACACKRELLRGVEASVARRRVLQQFGDPAAVARRLWLDAMKGKIMAQRLLVAACLVLMAAGATSVGLAWHWMNQDQLLKIRAAAEATEANRRMSEALAQSQSTNQEMLKQMRDMSETIRHPSSSDWNPVIFQLTEEATDGPPAADFSLTLTRLEGNAAGMMGVGGGMGGMGGGMGGMGGGMGGMGQGMRVVLPPGIIAQAATGQYGGMGGMAGTGAGIGKTIYRKSGASGVVDFGAVQPGDYTFRINKNWVKGYFSTDGQFNVGPGSKVQKSILCPKTPPELVTVRVRCSWPADLEKEQLVLYAPFVFRYRKIQPDVEWFLADTFGRERPRRRSNLGMMANQVQGFSAVRSVLCGPGTMLTEILKSKGFFLWSLAQGDAADPAKNAARLGPGRRSQGGLGGMGQLEVGARLGPGDWADILMQDLREVKLPNETPEPHELGWETGTYGLDELIVLRPSRSPNVETGRRRFDVLAASRVSVFQYPVRLCGAPPEKNDLETVYQNMTGRGFMPPWGWPGMQGANQGGEGSNDQFQFAAPTLDLPTEYWDQVDFGFEARLGRVNEWTIRLPEELIKAVREALKTEVKPRARLRPVPNSGLQ
jgi:hypothetical protein